jgi:Protein of unknown function (DUF1588)/Protein of unknown function (DUF1587)/Protein of unknown function (DUF1592)/Protein of unknown function (DUF1585)/Protein of unknown function (DUF1595)
MPTRLSIVLSTCLVAVAATGASLPGANEFHKNIWPLLETYCFDCHADGANKGNVAFDTFSSDQAILGDRELWLKALKMLRANLMPPPKKIRPSSEQQEEIARWIKRDVFGLDPQNPDPGRVTIRRLNRVEYRNTVRDLLGVDFEAQTEFPPDDTGNGFDNMADVLTLPPMLLEKYVSAANRIIAQAVPTVSASVRERVISGDHFGNGTAPAKHPGTLSLSYYTSALVSNTFHAEFDGQYQLAVDLLANEKFVDNVFDYNRCRLTFQVDGKTLTEQEYGREGGRPYHYDFDQTWESGDHTLSFQLQPLTPDQKQVRSLSLQLSSITVRGPMEKGLWVRPANYERFFPRPVPGDSKGRRAYAREVLQNFADRAFRRPADAKTVDRLVSLAEGLYTDGGKTFEAGVAQAMVAVLASPRFLFREEAVEAGTERETYPLIDEYALASRLSYFLWSSMPDEELLSRARAGTLRKNLPAQVARLLQDRRSRAFIDNFTGQWLRARDVESIPIEARAVLAREDNPDPEFEIKRKRFRELRDKPEERLSDSEREDLANFRANFRRTQGRFARTELTGELRHGMRMETERVFSYVLREDRSLQELLDCDYTFLNERLARYYGLTNVFGDEMRLVKLSPDSPRGGILTEGTVLVATSNPTRTSPVKRGVFILDSILGMPVPPPPPDIPPLEDANKGLTNHAPSLRETLAAHRENALCSSCHSRLDPLGLALENFNALGLWREFEFNRAIDATGRLATGEEFSNPKEFKRILAQNHSRDFYRTLTEKLLMYALGRGLDYYDVETVDQIVAKIEKSGGRPSALLSGIVESAPFEKTRRPATLTTSAWSARPLVTEKQ